MIGRPQRPGSCEIDEGACATRRTAARNGVGCCPGDGGRSSLQKWSYVRKWYRPQLGGGKKQLNREVSLVTEIERGGDGAPRRRADLSQRPGRFTRDRVISRQCATQRRNGRRVMQEAERVSGVSGD